MHYPIKKSRFQTISPAPLQALLTAGVISIAATPIVSQVVHAQADPVICQSVTSDHDDDGWGWENGVSCMVSTGTVATQFAWCNDSTTDLDGDGWGWENNASCIVQTTIGNTPVTTPTCTTSAADTDGDGWGWENGESCLAPATGSTSTTAFPACVSSLADTDGDGWGWENGQSCTAATGGTSQPNTDTGTGTGTGTDGVLCDYVDSTYNSSASVNATSTSGWTCSETSRLLTANGLPDHDTGTFPNAANPNTITAQSVSATYTLDPQKTDTATTLGGPAGVTGYVLNGVKIDAGTGGSCDDSGTNCSLASNTGSWNIEALSQTSFDFGTDFNNAHVQPDGQYHYHGMPEGFITRQGGNSNQMTLIGWAADGFPIYARYGYSVASDSSSALKNITGSYQLVSSVDTTRPATNTYALGTFAQDWEYVAGSGDLDECNGRDGVTPEFPGGTYHYFATDSYPFFQRCVKGAVQNNIGGAPGGTPPAGPQR